MAEKAERNEAVAQTVENIRRLTDGRAIVPDLLSQVEDELLSLAAKNICSHLRIFRRRKNHLNVAVVYIVCQKMTIMDMRCM